MHNNGSDFVTFKKRIGWIVNVVTKLRIVASPQIEPDWSSLKPSLKMYKEPLRTNLAILVESDTLQLGKPHKIGADQDSQLLSFPLSTLSITRVSLVLHAHPQLVHLRKVHQNKVY